MKKKSITTLPQALAFAASKSQEKSDEAQALQVLAKYVKVFLKQGRKKSTNNSSGSFDSRHSIRGSDDLGEHRTFGG